MRHKTTLAAGCCLLALLLLAGSALAKTKKEKKPDAFTAFEEELLQTSGMDEDDEAALKFIRKCSKHDEAWQRQLQDPQTYSLWDTREKMRVSVACWDKATTKDTGHEGIDAWVDQWLAYQQGAEMWVWARIARMEGQRDTHCMRMAEAEKLLTATGEAAQGIPEQFTTEQGQDLARAPYEASLSFLEQARQMMADSGCD